MLYLCLETIENETVDPVIDDAINNLTDSGTFYKTEEKLRGQKNVLENIKLYLIIFYFFIFRCKERQLSD